MRWLQTTLARAAVTTFLAWSPTVLLAAEESPRLTFSAFGTLGGVTSDARGADFVGSLFQPDGAGASRRWSLGVDSKLGAQANLRIGHGFSAVVQVVAQHRYDDSYTPTVEWANLMYEATPELTLRVGRFVSESFLESEARLVTYASLWIRPPQELYGLVPVTNKDGVDLTYRLQRGSAGTTLRASVGQTTASLPGGGHVSGRRFLDLNTSVDLGPTLLRVGYTSLRGSYRSPDIAGLVGEVQELGGAIAALPGDEALGRGVVELGRRYLLNDFPYTVLTAGVSSDPGSWHLQGEWARARGKGLLADSRAWYLLCGFRLKDVTPFVGYATLHATRLPQRLIETAALPEPLAMAAGALNDGLSALTDGYTPSQSTSALGLRWDAFRRAAFKIQYERVRVSPHSSGRLGYVQSDFRSDAIVHAFSLSVDFVY